MTEKTVNYTDEQTARIVEHYEAAEDSDEARAVAVDELATEFQRKPASIRAKLVSSKVYIKKTYVSKAGSKTETKGTIVSSIATLLEVNEDRLAGLDKATKPTLEFLRGVFVSTKAALAGETQKPDSE